MPGSMARAGERLQDPANVNEADKRHEILALLQPDARLAVRFPSRPALTHAGQIRTCLIVAWYVVVFGTDPRGRHRTNDAPNPMRLVEASCRCVHVPYPLSCRAIWQACMLGRLDFMVARDGFEPPTPAFSGQRSTKLSYLALNLIVT